MRVGDLIKRKWNVAKMGPLPSGYRAGIVVGFTKRTRLVAPWAVVRWADGHGIGNSLYHPDNLEVISESR